MSAPPAEIAPASWWQVALMCLGSLVWACVLVGWILDFTGIDPSDPAAKEAIRKSREEWRATEAARKAARR